MAGRVAADSHADRNRRGERLRRHPRRRSQAAHRGRDADRVAAQQAMADGQEQCRRGRRLLAHGLRHGRERRAGTRARGRTLQPADFPEWPPRDLHREDRREAPDALRGLERREQPRAGRGLCAVGMARTGHGQRMGVYERHQRYRRQRRHVRRPLPVRQARSQGEDLHGPPVKPFFFVCRRHPRGGRVSTSQLRDVVHPHPSGGSQGVSQRLQHLHLPRRLLFRHDDGRRP